MSRIFTITAITACYFLFGMLLNSVGTVILQSIQSFDISKADASVLEGFKDLPIAIVSFLVAAVIPKIGYKVALILALVAVGIVSLAIPSIAEFWSMKVLFAVIGSAFAFVKVAVYTIIGQLTNGTREHASLMNTIEGFFMLGVLSGYWVFSYFIDPTEPANLSWLNVYYLIVLIIAIVAIILTFAPIQSPLQENLDSSIVEDFTSMAKLTLQPLVLIFIVSVFLYVLIEQGIGTWLPTYNNEVLNLPANISVQVTSVFALMLAVGRLGAGLVLKIIGHQTLIYSCLVAMVILILLSVPLASDINGTQVSSLASAPFAVYVLPMIGLFMAPIYPMINSAVLSALAKKEQAKMTGLIVVFSALGGTTGSLLTGFAFGSMGGQTAFYLVILPISLLAVSIFVFSVMQKRSLSVSVNSSQIGGGA